MNREKFLKQSMLALGSFYLFPASALAKNNSSEAKKHQDVEIETDIVYVQGVESYIKCFQARPAISGTLPCLILIHDKKGLNKFYMEKAKEWAQEGFHVLAPDALSPLGGTMGELNENRNAIKKLDINRLIENYTRTIRYIQNLEGKESKVGVVGYGWGGTLVHELGIRSSNLSAAVSYFGAPPKGDIAKLNIPLMLHQSQADETLKESKSSLKASLSKVGQSHEWVEHKGTKRNFHNEWNKEKFDKTARDEAWKASVAYLKKHLAN